MQQPKKATKISKPTTYKAVKVDKVKTDKGYEYKETNEVLKTGVQLSEKQVEDLNSQSKNSLIKYVKE